jgi:hypothetical protein
MSTLDNAALAALAQVKVPDLLKELNWLLPHYTAPPKPEKIKRRKVA